MPTSTVALTRCPDYSRTRVSEAIARQFELLGGLDRLLKRGDRVLLKPNFIVARSRRRAAQTDPAVIIEVARLLKDFGARPFLGDSPAWGNLASCVTALKLEKPLKDLGVEIVRFDKPRQVVIGPMGTKVGIAAAVLEADAIINLPKFKSHQQLVATFAVKNMFGCVAGKQKAYLHFSVGGSESDFCRMLIEIFRFLNPVVTIIDAVTVMDGPGPIRGRARPLGWVIGGVDPIACELVCSRLVDMEPESLPIVREARRMGFGCSDWQRIKVVGDGFPDEVCEDFELPELIPIRFSLLRVCRSIGRQIFLLAKSRIKRSKQSKK